MVRPRRCRRVGCVPSVTYFKPAGISLKDLEQVDLSYDECEALRLKDFLGLSQKESATKMDVSQPTFHRLVIEARRKVSEALVFGKAIQVRRGENIMDDRSEKKMKKIAVSVGAKGLEGEVDGRFGRCSHFLIITVDRGEVAECEPIENPHISMRSGAGVAVAQTLAEREIDAVITGEVGPRASDVLEQFGIRIIAATGLATVAIDNFIKGENK